MKNSKIIIIIIVTLIISGFFPLPRAQAIDPISLDAAAGMLVHPESGTVLFEKDADVRLYPASITKIMTTLLIVEAIEAGELSLDELVTASDTFEFDLEADGSTQNIKPGEQMTLENLLYCIMVASANEACNIAAELYCGTAEAFIAKMNERALELGCKDTKYANTHGLHDDEHYTTARDVYIISNEAIKHQLFLKLSFTSEYTVPATNLSDARKLKNTNMLITDQYSGYYTYEYCLGGKTGSTSKAGNCLMSHSIKDGIELICIVMGSETEQLSEDVFASKCFPQSIELYNWGYANFSNTTIVNTTDMVTEAKVLGGTDADYVVLHPAYDITFFLSNDYDAGSFEKVIRLNSAEGASAPIVKGQCLGVMDLYQDENYLCSVDLIALTAVSGNGGGGRTADPDADKGGVNWLVVLVVVILVLAVLYIALIIFNTVRRRRRKVAAASARRVRR